MNHIKKHASTSLKSPKLRGTFLVQIECFLEKALGKAFLDCWECIPISTHWPSYSWNWLTNTGSSAVLGTLLAFTFFTLQFLVPLSVLLLLFSVPASLQLHLYLHCYITRCQAIEHMYIIFSKFAHLATNNPALVIEYPDWSLCCVASQQNWINLLTSRYSGTLKLCDQNWLVCFCQLKHLLYVTALLRGSPQHRFWNLPFPYTKVHLVKCTFLSSQIPAFPT